MANKNEGLNCCVCLTVVSLAVFFGILFGVNYPEIKFIPTICQCLSAATVPRFCCNLNCNNTCDTSAMGLPQCESLVSQSQSLSPVTCSENSILCPKSGSDAYCDNGYYCCSYSLDAIDLADAGGGGGGDIIDNGNDSGNIVNIRKRQSCDKSTDHQGCQMTCDRCYNVELNLTYHVGQNQQNSLYIKDFSKSLDNANGFLSAHEPNITFQCYYNPSSVTDIILELHFTKWRWVLFAFSALALLLCLVALIAIICKLKGVDLMIAKHIMYL